MPHKRPEDRRAWRRQWRKDNKVKRREQERRRRLAHPAYQREYMRKWRAANREKVRGYERQRYTNDADFRLSFNIRRRIQSVVHSTGGRKSASTRKLTGCEPYQLQAHLEIQFKDGMNWENYGKVWHVDHKRPCCSFDLTDPQQQRECFSYKNLQPLFAKDNLQKSGKWPKIS